MSRIISGSRGISSRLPRRIAPDHLAGALLLSLLFGLTWSPARGAEPGYAILDDPLPTAPWQPAQVVEVFWSGCPDCAPLQAALDDLLARLPGAVEVRRLPAVAPGWEPQARAYYAAEALGAQPGFHRALLEAGDVIGGDGDQPAFPRSRAALIDFAANHGLDADAFAAAFDSPAVDAQVAEAAALTERYGIEGVPSLIIDGRYRTSLALAGGMPRMLEVTDDLLRAAIARQQQGTNRRRR